MTKYKGVYRLRTETDKRTNLFPREYNGQFADNDVYIDCANKVQIFSFSRGILEAYIPSLQTGRTILKLIYRDLINKNNTETKINTYDVTRNGETVSVTKETITILDEKLFVKDMVMSNLILHTEQTDEEILFRFNSKNMDKLEKYLKPKTSGANISPFSSKNLPRNKTYKIPDEDLSVYKDLTRNLAQNELILLGRYTTNFIKSLATKKNTWEMIKSDMALKGIKGKDYIHSIGKWEEYMKFLKENL